LRAACYCDAGALGVVISAGEAYGIMHMQKCNGQAHTAQRVCACSLIPYAHAKEHSGAYMFLAACCCAAAAQYAWLLELVCSVSLQLLP
jgi:hypothetical protein